MAGLLHRLVAVGFLGAMFLLGCAVDPKKTARGAGKESCPTEGGPVNTYNLIGKWKKVSSTAEAPTTEQQRQFDYDLFVFEPGAALCMGRVVNKALASAVFKGTYTHDVEAQVFNVSYTAHVDDRMEGTSEDVRYSFSGSCGETKLNLVYPKDGTVEQYELFSTKVEQGDCK